MNTINQISISTEAAPEMAASAKTITPDQPFIPALAELLLQTSVEVASNQAVPVTADDEPHQVRRLQESDSSAQPASEGQLPARLSALFLLNLPLLPPDRAIESNYLGRSLRREVLPVVEDQTTVTAPRATLIEKTTGSSSELSKLATQPSAATDSTALASLNGIMPPPLPPIQQVAQQVEPSSLNPAIESAFIATSDQAASNSSASEVVQALLALSRNDQTSAGPLSLPASVAHRNAVMLIKQYLGETDQPGSMSEGQNHSAQGLGFEAVTQRAEAVLKLEAMPTTKLLNQTQAMPAASFDVDETMAQGQSEGAASHRSSLPHPAPTELEVGLEPRVPAHRSTGEGFATALPQIIERVQTMAQAGTRLLRLSLQPESLGQLELRLTLAGSRLRVEINAAVAHTRAELQQSTATLREALNEKGFEVQAIQIGSLESHFDAATQSFTGSAETRSAWWDEIAHRQATRHRALPNIPAEPETDLPSLPAQLARILSLRI